jgi:hypothetical protein
MGRGILGIYTDMQLMILPWLSDGQNDGLLIRLGYLIYAPPGESVIQFTHQRAHGKAVKTHDVSP